MRDRRVAGSVLRQGPLQARTAVHQAGRARHRDDGCGGSRQGRPRQRGGEGPDEAPPRSEGRKERGQRRLQVGRTREGEGGVHRGHRQGGRVGSRPRHKRRRRTDDDDRDSRSKDAVRPAPLQPSRVLVRARQPRRRPRRRRRRPRRRSDLRQGEPTSRARSRGAGQNGGGGGGVRGDPRGASGGPRRRGRREPVRARDG